VSKKISEVGFGSFTGEYCFLVALRGATIFYFQISTPIEKKNMNTNTEVKVLN
jgi:hypothetical protein